MKKYITLLLPFTLTLHAFAQGDGLSRDSTLLKSATMLAASVKWTDASLFLINRVDAKSTTPLIWFNHENGNYFLECRVNFDWANTAGVLIGKTFSKSPKFWITPKLGMLLSGRQTDGYNGVSPEFNFGGNISHFEYFTMNQYALGIDDKPDFMYQYTEVRFKCLKDHIALCYGIQFYREPYGGRDWWIDQGPVIILSAGKFYLKPWMTQDPNHRNSKMIVGIGYKP